MESWGSKSKVARGLSQFNMTVNNTAAQPMNWMAKDSTRELINQIELQRVQTIRTTNLTLGAFSLALSLLTIHRIISDARRVAKMQAPLRKPTFSFVSGLHPAEIYSLALACGVFIQQLVFIAVQGSALSMIELSNCRGLAMIVLPAIFLMGYITLIFGMETAYRAVNATRFSPRRKRTVSICIGIISLLLLLTWIPTIITTPKNPKCFGAIVWMPANHTVLILILMSGLIIKFIILAAIISIQLMRTPEVDPNECIAASRMCYHLLVTAIVYILTLPFYIHAYREDFVSTLASSRVAGLALFGSGIIIAFMHMFLRVNASRMVISPVLTPTQYSNKPNRPRIRLFGPSDLEMNISGPLSLQRPTSQQRLKAEMEKKQFDLEGGPKYFFLPEKQAPLSPGSMTSQGIDPTRWPLPPEPTQISPFNDKRASAGLHKRKPSNYSLFPTRAEDVPRLPATVYSPLRAGDERPPSIAERRQIRRSSLGDTRSVTDVSAASPGGWLPPPRPLFSRNHNRSGSTDSCATVQIGLRFSVAPVAIAGGKLNQAMTPPLPGPPPLNRGDTGSSRFSLGFPIQSPSNAASSPSTFSEKNSETQSPAFTGNFVFLSDAPRDSGPYLQAQTYRIPSPKHKSVTPALLPSPMPLTPENMSPPQVRQQFLSGLRMNPVSASSFITSARSKSPTGSETSAKSPSNRSPTAKIGLGAGTMARSSPSPSWI